MKNLATNVTSNVFDNTILEKELVKEYYERSERKKEDEAWLKKYGNLVKDIMVKQNKNKEDVDDLRVSISIPDTSHFDNEKLLKYLLLNYPNLKEHYISYKIDEDGLEYLIKEGHVDVEELRENAWVVSKGSPRLIVKKLK